MIVFYFLVHIMTIARRQVKLQSTNNPSIIYPTTIIILQNIQKWMERKKFSCYLCCYCSFFYFFCWDSCRKESHEFLLIMLVLYCCLSWYPTRVSYSLNWTHGTWGWDGGCCRWRIAITSVIVIVVVVTTTSDSNCFLWNNSGVSLLVLKLKGG